MKTQATKTAELVDGSIKPLLKIALDVHLVWHVIVSQEEGASPQPPQRFKPSDLLKWIKQKLAAGYRIITCYAAGLFGYGLHQQLVGLGVTNYVIRPRIGMINTCVSGQIRLMRSPG